MMNEEQNKLRLPKDWQWIKLEDLVDEPKRDLVDGPFGSNLKADEYTESGVPVLKIQNIKANRFIDKRISFITEEKAQSLNRHSFKVGDLIITKLGEPLGLCCRVPSKYPYGIIVADLMRLRPSKIKVYDEYLLQVINSDIVQNQFKKITKGTTRARVNLTIVRNIIIPIPPRSVQEAIVSKIEELFSELDKSIETLHLAQQQLKTYRHAVLKWAFEGKLTEEWRKENGTKVRVPAAPQESYVVSSGIEPKLLVAETVADYQGANENGKLPEGWKLEMLGKYIEDISAGKSFRCEERPPNENEVGIVKVSSVTWGFFDEEESKTCFSNDYYNEKYLIQSDDFLFSRANTIELIGACVIVDKVEKTLMLSDKILRFTFSKAISQRYALYYLRSRKGRKQIEMLSTGNQDSMRNIGQEKIRQIAFPYCPIEIQKEVIKAIESRFSVADKLEDNIKLSLQQAEALRQSILKKAFEGNLIIAKKPTVYKPKNEYFYQAQFLGLIIRASKKKDIAHGEMTIAKYGYLLDKIYGVPTYYDYKRWHLGPYPPEMKKAINNKSFFKKQNGNIEVADEETLFKYNNHYQKEIESAVDDLAAIFSKYSAKERAHKTELLATVCKVVEDIQTLDLKAVRASMKEWKIELETLPFKNKAEKFTEAETERCLDFIVEMQWKKTLLHQ